MIVIGILDVAINWMWKWKLNMFITHGAIIKNDKPFLKSESTSSQSNETK